MSAAEADAEPVGTLAEEAVRLFRAMVPTDNPDLSDAVASVTQSAAALARSLRDLVDTALTPPSSDERQSFHENPSPQEHQ